MLSKNYTVFVAATIMLASSSYVDQAGAQYVKEDLLGYWSFDADTIAGDVIKDMSGNNNHGKINFPVKAVPGKVGGALEFDGGSSHYVATEVMITEEHFKSLTMMAWAKPYEAHGAWGSVMNADDGGWDRGFGYRADAWEIQVGHGGDWQPGELADLNVWQHTVLIYTPTNVIFYKNGKRFEFGKRTTPTTSSNPLIIGHGKPGCVSCAFPGAIDEVLLYGRELTDAEVQQNFKSEGFAVDAAGKLSLTWGAVKALR